MSEKKFSGAEIPISAGSFVQQLQHPVDISSRHSTGIRRTDICCCGTYRRIHIPGKGSSVGEPGSTIISGQIEYNDGREIVIPENLNHQPGISSFPIPGNYDVIGGSECVIQGAQES